MVKHGFSVRRIRSYLNRWLWWWVKTSETWQYQELITWFIEACWEEAIAAYATELLKHHVIESHAMLGGLSAAV